MKTRIRLLFLTAACLTIAGASFSSLAGAPREVESASGVAMIYVPGGWFHRGAPEGRAEETPRRRIWVDSFFMDKTPVTQAEYERVMEENPSNWTTPHAPVEQVRWYDAVRYCNKRSEKEGLEPVYCLETWNADFEASGYRLPTEAEWEYTARAGTETAYFFGDDDRRLAVFAWFARNAGGRTRPVGRKLPNPWGFQDILGNVWEWCHDVYDPDYYAESPERNPRGPDSGDMRTLRGGAWETPADRTTVTARFGEKPGYADVCLGFERYGFRPVRSAESEAGTK